MGIQGMGFGGGPPEWEGKRKRQPEISVCLFIYSLFSVTLPSIVSVSDCISADNCIRDMWACISRFVLTWGSLYLGFVTLCGTRFISCGNKQGMFVWWLEIKQPSAQYECKLRMSVWKEQKTSPLAREYHFVFEGHCQSLKLARGIGVSSVELRERFSRSSWSSSQSRVSQATSFSTKLTRSGLADKAGQFWLRISALKWSLKLL